MVTVRGYLVCRRCGKRRAQSTYDCDVPVVCAVCDTVIPARHPVREAFAGCSTGAKQGSGRVGYYETKGHAVEAFSNALHDHAFCFDQEVYSDFDGNEGRKEMRVLNASDVCVSHAIISWYRMDSGRYEFTGYLS